MSFTSLYSNLFLSKFGSEDTTGTWFECLKDLTPLAIENGIETLRRGGANGKYAQFPPNPVEFRMLCLDYYEHLNLPSVAVAYEEITGRANRPCAAVKFTAKKLGADFFEIKDERVARVIFEKMYAKVCHLVRMGHELPDEPEPLLLQKPISRDVGKSHLKALKQHLGI
jgi:hypothetical protein